MIYLEVGEKLTMVGGVVVATGGRLVDLGRWQEPPIEQNIATTTLTQQQVQGRRLLRFWWWVG